MNVYILREDKKKYIKMPEYPWVERCQWFYFFIYGFFPKSFYNKHVLLILKCFSDSKCY